MNDSASPDYTPTPAVTGPVVEPGEFAFAASHFDHGHIYGQIHGLAGAGGTLKYVFDTQDGRVERILEAYPDAVRVQEMDQILEDEQVQLITSAAIPNERCDLGLRIMDAGKHYLTDKAPVTSLEQLERARKAVSRTGMKYAVCYSERLCNEAAWYAGELIEQGAIGKVVQVLNLAPHRLGAAGRPDWFFQKEPTGGIITDIGSHQFEQFLCYAGADDGDILSARVDNFDNPDFPEFEDFGEASLRLSTAASAYCRIDWFTPDASRTWGDGRTFVLGTEGYIEIRKTIDLARPTRSGNRLFLCNHHTEQEIDCSGKVGTPYFGNLILDILHGTETAMTQAHAFKAAELSMQAQAVADANRDQGEGDGK